jgi:hypothetical protein
MLLKVSPSDYLTQRRWPPQWAGRKRQIALAVLGLAAVWFFWTVMTSQLGNFGQDIDSGWLAALRIRSGEPLYVNSGSPPDTWYSYAPWFAWLWIPLTFLPLSAVIAAWSMLLAACWLASLWPVRHSVALLLIFAPLTFYAVWVGNVQPVMIASLVWTIRTRWGPVALGAAASIKVVPILLALVWIRQGEWRKAAVAAGVAIALGAPALLYGVEHYPFGLQAQLSLRAVSPALWLVAVVVIAADAFLLGRTRWGYSVAALAVIVARPALVSYDAGYLLIGAPTDGNDSLGSKPPSILGKRKSETATRDRN